MINLNYPQPENYQALLDSLDAIFWEADQNLIFSFVSPQVKRILGYSPQEWAADPDFWAKHLHPDDRDRAVNFCEEETKQLRSHSLEYRMIAADGETIWLRDIVSVEAQEGKPAKLRGIIVDISPLKHTQIQLEQSEERFRNLAEAALEGVFIHHHGKIMLANAAAAQIFGYHTTELVEMNVAELAAPESRALIKKNIEECFANAYEARGLRKDGSKNWCELRGKETIYLGCSMRVTTVRDITDRKMWEAQRENILEQERNARVEAERLIALRDDFLAVASHELRTPLTPLQMNVQLLRKCLGEADLPQTPKLLMLEKALRQGEIEVAHLSRLVEDLLDVTRFSAKKVTIKKKNMDLSLLTKEILARMAPGLEQAGCALELDLRPGVVGFWDPARLDQVITNLVTNAMKYGEGKPVRVGLSTEGDCAKLRVRDQGIGISPENHEKIFERFERVAPVESYRGLGLGLFIARQIVGELGGYIRVDSQLGQGATFLVELPLRTA